MAGVDPAIHELPCFGKGVDARAKPAHDDAFPINGLMIYFA